MRKEKKRTAVCNTFSRRFKYNNRKNTCKGNGWIWSIGKISDEYYIQWMWGY